mmetsp:Transcript_384/g.449  ORF Transcript_384/g.449 Transcript_384/m.449 type:complete len:794 (+) Transcript_384:369-2750(+)|eukprot:CAMPEP_0203761304 /NCGR_PEP_ID=MMETSP0098-20131031/14413_1 /ASSEMBLY_ACC=CAM_ASM_000208 /TAXON_ID=96639 /ORGANISM=" , Strain NY0313808BC1" /LENGTH=793 /DNA_ID=CAMNT_0050655227 /DNA_START=192 /DNA_END=2573 /DNA_ORIENTATION=-
MCSTVKFALDVLAIVDTLCAILAAICFLYHTFAFFQSRGHAFAFFPFCGSRMADAFSRSSTPSFSSISSGMSEYKDLKNDGVKTYFASLDDDEIEQERRPSTSSSCILNKRRNSAQYCRRQSGEFTPVPSTAGSTDSSSEKKIKRVRVAVRCRPAFREDEENDLSVRFQYHNDVPEQSKFKGRVFLSTDDRQPFEKSFSFDHLFRGEDSQQDVYDVVARPIVEDVLKGYNGAIMAYGQTGTGKTHTMGILHHLSPMASLETVGQHGIIPGAFQQIFSQQNSTPCNQGESCKCRRTVSISFLQVYLETLQDLLAPFDGGSATENLSLREDPKSGFYVQGLRSFQVKSFKEAMTLLNLGLENRNMACTTMNTSSSRSHTVLTVHVDTVKCSRGNPVNIKAKLRLVDLAGSERVRASTTKGLRVKEAKAINVSLSALGNVVSALAQRESSGRGLSGVSSIASVVSSESSGSSALHIPFRDSKLTRLLQDTLGGRIGANTALIATVGPGATFVRETLSTLKFASRCMKVKSEVKIRRETNHAERCAELESKILSAEREFSYRENCLRQAYEQEISTLRHRLELKTDCHTRDSEYHQQVYEMYSNVMQFVQEQKQQLEEQKEILCALVEANFPDESKDDQGNGQVVENVKIAMREYITPKPFIVTQERISKALGISPALVKPAFVGTTCLDVNVPQIEMSYHSKIATQVLRLEAEDSHMLLKRLTEQLVHLHVESSRRDTDLNNCSHVLKYLLKTNAKLRSKLNMSPVESNEIARECIKSKNEPKTQLDRFLTQQNNQ